MTEYYCDPTASGINDGTTKINAWTTLQQAIDGVNGTQPGPGDTVLCKSSGSGDDEILTQTIDMDGLSGDITSGRTTFIGTNSLWVNDGTRYVINANSTTTGLLGSGNYKHLENFEIYGASGAGLDWTNATWDDWFLKNIVSRDNSGAGFNEYYSGYFNFFLECQAYNNSGGGFIYPYHQVHYLLCSSHDNTGYGFQQGTASTGPDIMYGCLSYNNTLEGVLIDNAGICINTVSHENNGDGFDISGYVSLLIGCRSTSNGGYGLKSTSGIMEAFQVYLGGNTSGSISGLLVNKVLMQGAETVTVDGSDTNQGYTSVIVGSEDFNLRTDATQRRVAVSLE